ncbi:hypothetical protein Xcc3_21350 [Xanthomonas campestris pv. campestris]|uniref:Uncharacterized protein n=3 Tax=Xanthomonas TaxID=338 RepID=Q3C018_XANE5|nr:hypothetical protein Xcc3_21350 [Xanthomonas campestris pv. campestris]CAJ19898.1 hypothetical protein XCVd0086 [Xanthomonas euvesicatoria pv. vesicatoria str. 85-10]
MGSGGLARQGPGSGDIAQLNSAASLFLQVPMRITNDNYSPIELLAEIATRRGTTSADTHRFFQGGKTSHDWLVEEWSSRVDCILESFKRYGIDVNATQFVRDQGIDVLLRVPNHQGKEWRLGFQIKSEQEAERDRTKKPGQENMIGTLKRQAHDAFERVDEWWILCCFDLDKHYKLVQGISSELTGGKQNRLIRVIDPRACAAMLRMSEAEVDAFCTLLLCRDDAVLRAAREEVAACHPNVGAFVLEHIVPALVDGERVSREEVASFLEEAFRKSERERLEDGGGEDDDCEAVIELDEDADEHGSVQDGIDDDEEFEDLDIHEMLQELESNGFLAAGTYDDDYRISPTAFPGVCALFFEARVRHGLNDDAAASYMRWLTLRQH